MLKRLALALCAVILVVSWYTPVFASDIPIRRPRDPQEPPAEVPSIHQSLANAQRLLVAERTKGNSAAQEVIDLVFRWNPPITIGEFLPPNQHLTAFYHREEKRLYFNSPYFVYNDHIVAVIIAEGIGLTHGFNTSGFTCIDTEVFSATLAAKLWESWFGPQGKPNPGDELENKYNTLVTLKTNNQLSATIASEIMRAGGCPESRPSQRPQPSSSRV